MNKSEICVEKFPAWVDNIDEAANEVNLAKEEAEWKKPSIHRVPKFVKKLNEYAFTPQVLSFGPFHNGAEHLQENEVHKHRALAHFLHRSGKQSNLFISRLRCILKQLQDSYQGLDEKWKCNKDDEFLKMMLLDGCFMIEVLRQQNLSNDVDYATNDPVFSLQMMPLRIPYIIRDMLLLENQLPLLLLKKLLEVEGFGKTGDQYIHELVLTFFGKELNEPLKELASHPLMLYRMSLLQGNCEHKIDLQSMPLDAQVLANAVELRESGVRFRKLENMSLCDTKFYQKTGVLELPVILVDDGTEHIFSNMIAYEQIHVGAGNEITSYVMLMDELIDTEADVKLLQRKEIIINVLGSHKAVAELFNRLAKETVVDPDKDVLQPVKNDLSKYYKNRGNRWLAKLRHQYLHSPWKVISIGAGFIALLLTTLQTLYTVLQFHLRK